LTLKKLANGNFQANAKMRNSELFFTDAEEEPEAFFFKQPNNEKPDADACA
jgi:hypothetical protein